jgi:hypothetical protein
MTLVILRRNAGGEPTKDLPEPSSDRSVRSQEILRSLRSLRMTAGGGLYSDPSGEFVFQRK